MVQRYNKTPYLPNVLALIFYSLEAIYNDSKLERKVVKSLVVRDISCIFTSWNKTQKVYGIYNGLISTVL